MARPFRLLCRESSRHSFLIPAPIADNPQKNGPASRQWKAGPMGRNLMFSERPLRSSGEPCCRRCSVRCSLWTPARCGPARSAAGSAHCSKARCSAGCCLSTGCSGIPSSVCRAVASRSKTRTAAPPRSTPARRNGSSPRNCPLRWLAPPGRPRRERSPPAENGRTWCFPCSSARTRPPGWRTWWPRLPQPMEPRRESFPPRRTAPLSAARCWNLVRSGSHAPKAPLRRLRHERFDRHFLCLRQ